MIEATGNVVQYGNGKTVEDVISHLAQRFFDPSAQVSILICCCSDFVKAFIFKKFLSYISVIVL